MKREQIEQRIPHRPPFLLLDEVVELEGERIVCRRTFRDDDFWFAGHYPEFPLVPGVLLCEAGMQAGAVLLRHLVGESDADNVPVATRLNNVKFKQMVRPGECIEIAVVLTERLLNAYFLAARVTMDGKLAASFDFACALAEAEK